MQNDILFKFYYLNFDHSLNKIMTSSLRLILFPLTQNHENPLIPCRILKSAQFVLFTTTFNLYEIITTKNIETLFN